MSVRNAVRIGRVFTALAALALVASFILAGQGGILGASLLLVAVLGLIALTGFILRRAGTFEITRIRK